MKSNIEIQQELIDEFGKDYHTIDNLIKWLKVHYHPQIFTSMKEFMQTPYFHTKKEMSVDEYTDDYITENEKYIIILFDDARDFDNMPDDYSDDIIVSFDKESGKISKYYYTGYYNSALPYVQSFIDADK